VTPRILEEDERYVPVFPHEARMRNLTYATEVYSDITLSKKELDENNYEIDQVSGQRKRKVKQIL
jgi:DNA-directed RNA polymerase beta subunit